MLFVSEQDSKEKKAHEQNNTSQAAEPGHVFIFTVQRTL